MTEVAFEVLEAAGLTLDQIRGSKTGVWVGYFISDYKEMLYCDLDGALAYAATGLQKTSLANCLSWLWDLLSLVALHVACQSLRLGECDMAIVGGSNLLLGPDVFNFFGGQGFLLPDGKSKSFDASADGYGCGEGFAAVVLKRADDAILHWDLICAGTGTQAGDLAETLALSQTLASSRSAANRLLVGSVKSNIGHLEAVAGLAAVIKSVLVLEKGMIPPNIHLKTPNPKIPFDDWNLAVPTALTVFPPNKSHEGLRRISVNSFGYGGTNAHAILDDAASYLNSRAITDGLHFTSTVRVRRDREHLLAYAQTTGEAANSGCAGEPRRPQARLYPITSQDRNGLARAKKALSDFLKSSSSLSSWTQEQQADFLGSVAYTLSEKRSHFQWKTYVVASSSSVAEVAETMNKKDAAVPETLSSRTPRLGFVFTGQGAQWPGMGMALSEAYPVFRESIEAADAYLRDQLGCRWSAVRELGEPDKTRSNIGAAEYSQPLCTILQVALVDLLKSWNISPDAVTGHSSGEIAAAYCMGALSRESAWEVAFFRGTLSTALAASSPDLVGGMMALGLGREAATAMITRAGVGSQACVACVNSPSSVTISGDLSGVEKLRAVAEEEGVFSRMLHVDTAYHSFHMQMVAQDYMEAIQHTTDAEFRIHDGLVQVNRLVPDDAVNEEMNQLVKAAVPDTAPDTAPDSAPSGRRRTENLALSSLNANSCLQLAVETTTRHLDSLHFVEQDEAEPEPELGEDEVEISVKASHLTQTDLAAIKGDDLHHPPGAPFGQEASGIVTRVGSGRRTSHFKPGDRVVAVAPGAHSTLLRASVDCVAAIPDDMSFERAASLPLSLATAWYALVHLARPRPRPAISARDEAVILVHDPLSPVAPVPCFGVGITGITAAFSHVGGNNGTSAVLTYSQDDVVSVKLIPKPLDFSASSASSTSSLQLALDPDAIYVLSGGLGGLGRSLSTFLVDQLGARKLLFLSRSGAAAPSARQLLSHLETSAAQPSAAAYACDISDRRAVDAAIVRAEAELRGKVRGVIQCAMVLRDVLWSNMTYRDWVESTLPKIQGTSNLSAAMPELDFFISLSSFAGIFGNRGQANYAAGNCFQDSLARHRRQKLGLNSGLTIDVPIMRGIGVLAETGMVDSLKDWEVPYGIGEAEFHHLMRLAIRRDMNLEPSTHRHGHDHHQFILGIATGASAVVAGIPTPFYLEDDAKFAIMSKMDLNRLRGHLKGAANDAADVQASIQTLLSEVENLEGASELVTQALVLRVAKMQQVEPQEVDPGRFLHTYGVDSLVAIEIVNWALKELKSKINVFDVMAGIPITAFAENIAKKSELIPVDVKDA
ncbi:Lovastatin diketide synthase LovF [Colletotrichum tanaceti]|uniref:Lovastatin diketide synthase LovF n=1 Tax=Colletotrichum tanaceti TaxID=1306861 RepID=A0A4U6XHA1_9PEZI|nr:Lovastatin diketide synthase LovF [Colletotrichum tanaceti]TKW54672.1 Lovastatin diketide synthase LovF [Colletotrichum tanaceti]